MWNKVHVQNYYMINKCGCYDYSLLSWVYSPKLLVWSQLCDCVYTHGRCFALINTYIHNISDKLTVCYASSNKYSGGDQKPKKRKEKKRVGLNLLNWIENNLNFIVTTGCKKFTIINLAFYFTNRPPELITKIVLEIINYCYFLLMNTSSTTFQC